MKLLSLSHVLLLFSFFLNLFFFLLCSLSSSETYASGGSWWWPSWGGDGSPVRYNPGNLVGLISSELGVRATPPGCSARRCSAGLLLGGRKHSVMAALTWSLLWLAHHLSIIPAVSRNTTCWQTADQNLSSHSNWWLGVCVCIQFSCILNPVCVWMNYRWKTK